jgi:pimeloyl-ACP methyl ester carboxylesterase
MRTASKHWHPMPDAGGLHEAVDSAPSWFRAALADAPTRATIEVEGAGIETLAWGERGRPGVLLVHGFTAHADWWTFVAPQLANARRVVALSLSGMGRSSWRDAYSLEQYAREALTVAEDGGLFEAACPPILVGHSFGSFVARQLAQTVGSRLGGIVLVDGVITADEDDDEYDGVPRRGHRHRVYPAFGEAMARFRFSPPQPCEHPWIVELLARTSLHPVQDATGSAGWSWCFDPDLRAKFGGLPNATVLAPPACPMSLLFGDRSELLTPARRALLRRATPPHTPWIEVPDAGHHVMVDQPLALVAALRTQFEAWQPAATLNLA